NRALVKRAPGRARPSVPWSRTVSKPHTNRRHVMVSQGRPAEPAELAQPSASAEPESPAEPIPPAGPEARRWLELAAVEPAVLELRPDYTVLIIVAEGLRPGPS